MVKEWRPVEFRDSSLDDLTDFPKMARKEAGHQIHLVQIGEDPDDWKPMSIIGPGVREIRIKDNAGIYRIFYIAKFANAVYVLHCFTKKTQKTSKTDIDIGRQRYSKLKKELGL